MEWPTRRQQHCCCSGRQATLPFKVPQLLPRKLPLVPSQPRSCARRSPAVAAHHAPLVAVLDGFLRHVAQPACQLVAVFVCTAATRVIGSDGVGMAGK